MAGLQDESETFRGYNRFENATRIAVACLFCGKDIGPIRLLRDSEFCSPKHRKSYKDRLQKVLVQVGVPDTVPTHMAPFQDTTRPHPGSRQKSHSPFHFTSSQNHLRLPQSWTLSIPE